jgi:hypothetical protein
LLGLLDDEPSVERFYIGHRHKRKPCQSQRTSLHFLFGRNSLLTSHPRSV